MIWPNNKWAWFAFFLVLVVVVVLHVWGVYDPRANAATDDLFRRLRDVGVLSSGKGSQLLSADKSVPIPLEATLLIRVREPTNNEDQVKVTELEKYLTDTLKLGGWTRTASTTFVKLAEEEKTLTTRTYFISVDREVTPEEGDRPYRIRKKLKELFPSDSALVVVLRHPAPMDR